MLRGVELHIVGKPIDMRIQRYLNIRNGFEICLPEGDVDTLDKLPTFGPFRLFCGLKTEISKTLEECSFHQA